MNFSKCLNVVILSITHETIDDETDFVRLILGFFLDNRWKLEAMCGKGSCEPDFQGKS